MASPGRLLIPTESEDAAKSSSFQTRVEQIIKQKGAFRHVTSQKLQAELNGKVGLQTQEALVEAEDDADVTENNPEARRDHLWRSRDEMLQRLDYAQNEILSALDFVSWLLSSHAAGGQSSMSPSLKQVAPTGSLAARVVQTQESTFPSKYRLSDVSAGWKSKRFSSTSRTLGDAARRLQEESERQSTFWEQVAQLKTNGWSVSRLPNDSRSIVVHYGFADAAAHFRDRGVAVLRQTETGQLFLDQTSMPSHRKRLQVMIKRNGKTTGTSVDSGMSTRSSPGILSEISQARDQIFDEELFYELSREARLIANQRVTTQPDAIEVKVADRLQVCVAWQSKSEPRSSDVESDDRLAVALSDILRLLLISEHQQLHAHRSTSTPSPVSATARVRPEYALLRPLVTFLRHESEVAELVTSIQQTFLVLGRAGLECSLVRATQGDGLPDFTKIRDLRRPAKSRIMLGLPSKREIEVNAKSYIGAPVYGTQYDVGLMEHNDKTLTTSADLSESELWSILKRAINNDLTACILTWGSDGGRWMKGGPDPEQLVFYRTGLQHGQMGVQWDSSRLEVWLAQGGKPGKRRLRWTAQSCECLEADDTRREVRQTLRDLVVDPFA